MVELVPEELDVAYEMVGIRQAIDELELQFSRLAARFDKGSHWEQEGSNSPIDWIRFNCHLTSNAAGAPTTIAMRPSVGPTRWSSSPRARPGSRCRSRARSRRCSTSSERPARRASSPSPLPPRNHSAGTPAGGALGLRLQPEPDPDAGLGGDRCRPERADDQKGCWQLVKTDDGKIVTIAPTVTFGLPRGPD